MYAQQINGVWTELRGNVVFSPNVFQTAESLSDEQRAEFGVYPLVDMPLDPITATQKYGDPMFQLVDGVVQRSYPVLDKTAEEIEADRIAAVPNSVSMRQGRLAMLMTPYAGGTLLDVIEAMLNGIADPVQQRAARIDWEYAQTIERDFPLVHELTTQLGLTERQLDDLFTLAGSL